MPHTPSQKGGKTLADHLEFVWLEPEHCQELTWDEERYAHLISERGMNSKTTSVPDCSIPPAY